MKRCCCIGMDLALVFVRNMFLDCRILASHIIFVKRLIVEPTVVFGGLVDRFHG